jgi:hypothetical protein
MTAAQQFHESSRIFAGKAATGCHGIDGVRAEFVLSKALPTGTGKIRDDSCYHLTSCILNPESDRRITVRQAMADLSSDILHLES